MKSTFNARSPLWQILFIILFFCFLGLNAHEQDANSLANQYAVLNVLLGVVLVAYLGIYSFSIQAYNKTNPLKKIKLTGYTPAELNDEDEITELITARATRATYVFHSFAIPLFAVVAVIFSADIYITLVMMAMLAIGHYAIYWYKIWPILRE